MKRIPFILGLMLIVGTAFGQIISVVGSGVGLDTSDLNAIYLKKDFTIELLQDQTPSRLVVIKNNELSYSDIDDLKQSPTNYFVYDTNTYYTGAFNAAATTTRALAANQCFVFPLYVGRTILFDHVAVEVTSGVASNFIVGIYSDNGNMFPGSLIWSSSAFNGASADVLHQEIGDTIMLEKNKLYWEVWSASSNPTLRALAATSIWPFLGATTGANGSYTGYSNSSFSYSGTLPLTMSNVGFAKIGIAVPILYLREK